MNHFKIPYSNILFLLLAINPILSLIFDSTKVYYYYAMGPLIAFLLISMFLKDSEYSKQCKIIVGSFAASILLAIFYATSLGKIHNHMFNYLNTVLLFLYCLNDKNIEEFKQFFVNKIKLIKLSIIFINIVEAYYIISRKGYEVEFNWGGTFFKGTSGMPHTLSYLMLAVIIISICIILVEGKWHFAIATIIPFYALFESGARVTLLATGIFALILVDILFFKNQKNNKRNLLIALVVVVVAAFFLKDVIIESNLWKKTMLRIKEGNFTAGRFSMWGDLLYHYVHDSNIFQYFLGQGDDKTYYYNYLNSYVNVSVWAHNDFIQILVGKGLLGLGIYLYFGYMYVKKLFKRNGSYKTFLILGAILILAILNGFYSYRDISLVIPFIFIMNDYLFMNKKTI